MAEILLSWNAWAIIALAQAGFALGESAYLDAAMKLHQMMDLFEDKEGGGYFMTASDAETLIARPKETYDGAIPSGNSGAAMVLQKVAWLTGKGKWQEAAERQMQFLAGRISVYPASSCLGVLAMMDALYPHRELVCAVKGEIPEELLDYLKDNPAEDISVLVKTASNARELIDCAPFTADYAIPAHGVMFYLCENGACIAPVDSFSKLRII